ncbi:uncharacterized protein LOC142777189 [Rhipicephalus microplus]|uniref:uncharacterized protein LOC142777189 n=1 Tax=Rhipicephalus microplus TaxID=6941 RepID=UPI003F6B4498
MKILLLCGMILAGALFAKAATGRELCSLTNQEFKKLLKCMGDHVHPEFQETVRQVIGGNTDKVHEILKKQCEARVDFGTLLTSVFSENVALSVRSAYAACKPVKN